MSNFITKFFPRFSASPTQPDLRQSQGRFSVGKEEYAGSWEGPVNRSKAMPIKNDVLTFLSSQDLLSWIMTHMYYKEGEEKKYINDCAKDIADLLIEHRCKDQAYHAVEIIEKLESYPHIKGKKELLLALKEKLRGVEDSVSIVQLILEKRPSLILLSFIEDILPEKKKAVFTRFISRSTFFSDESLKKNNQNNIYANLTQDTKHWISSEDLEDFRKEFGDKSDLILALGWFAVIYSSNARVISRNFRYNKCFAPFFELKPEAVVQALHISKRFSEKVPCSFKDEWGKIYRECLLPCLIQTPSEDFYFYHAIKRCHPSLLYKRWENESVAAAHRKLLDILKLFKEQIGLEALFVGFFNVNYSDVLISDLTFVTLSQFFNESINQDIGKENNEKLKVLHQKWLNNKKWSSLEWNEYATVMSSQKDRWASICCFLYYLGNHYSDYDPIEYPDDDENTRRTIDAINHYKKSGMEPYCLSMRDPSYWEDLARHAPDLAHKILDIMKRSCGDRKEKQEDAAGIPEALLALEENLGSPVVAAFGEEMQA